MENGELPLGDCVPGAQGVPWSLRSAWTSASELDHLPRLVMLSTWIRKWFL